MPTERSCGFARVERVEVDRVRCTDETEGGITEWSCEGRYKGWCAETSDSW